MNFFKAIRTQVHLIKKFSFLAFFAFGFVPISSTLGQINFAPKVDYTTEADAHSVFAADLDGDGDLDLAITYLRITTVSVLMNNGDGTFAAKVDYSKGSDGGRIFAADLDGDGDQDLAATNYNDRTVSVLMNFGDGTFAAKVDYDIGGKGTSIFIADLDGDGNLDLAVGIEFAPQIGAIAVLMNNGDGTFAAKVDYDTEGRPRDVIAADLDSDGDLDLAVGHLTIPTVSVLENNGDGTFAAKVDYSLGLVSGTQSIVASDLDNDGDLDLAVPSFHNQSVAVLKNNGDGTFAAAVDFGVGLFGGSKIIRVFAADFDRDGDQDLGVIHVAHISILENNGDGTFALVHLLLTRFNPSYSYAADLDGDGDLDLAVPIQDDSVVDDVVSIFINITIPAVPPVGSVAGRVTANCPAANTGLLGVYVDAFDNADGELAPTAVTVANGNYQIDDLPAGDYTITVVTPLGYSAAAEEIPVTVAGGDIVTVDFTLICTEIIANPRTIGFWKHQVGVALGGKGNAQIDATTLCSYLDMIEAHFNSNEINEVMVYEPPGSGLCSDKLQAIKGLLNLRGQQEMIARARQQLMALLLNIAAGNISQTEVISEDGATVSQSVTYCDNLIDDSNGDHEMSKTICDDINNGRVVPAGIIPLGTQIIAYKHGVIPKVYSLDDAYPNPFNPTTEIRYALPEATYVTLQIYNLLGQRVLTLVDEYREAGEHTVVWNGDNMASGVYLYRLQAGEFVETRKMMLLK